MFNLIKKIYQRQIFRYIFFGGCTTLVNLVSYGFLRYLLDVDILKASFISILLSILFAYVVNKLFVFESKKNNIRELLKEFGSFTGMRLITMFVETFGTMLLSCVWSIPDMWSKLLMQVVVLVLNFIFSKLIVFSARDCHVYMTEKERKAQLRKKRCIGISFAIPAVTMFIAYIVNGVYPFGDHGVLIIDSLHQYLPFFTDFHQKLANSESLLYSFGGGLGYNMWATIAYYLASPFNFLMSLVSMDHVMDFMAYLILLKISLSGMFFAWYLSDRNKGSDYMPIPFACMYALSSFMIGYYFNIMWLDSVMVLPLVMKGIERITQGKSGKLFAGSLFYGLYCNYYIGYMLCLFSCLYFLAQWIAAKRFVIRKFIKSGLRFAWYALLSGGMAAILLVPAYMNLGITESANNSFPTKVKFYTNTLAQLSGHFALVEPINIYDNQSGVNIYCGVIILILVILYILDQELQFKERLSKVVLAGMFLLSMNFNMLNYIWHGFHIQNGLPNRFAFLYTGILLVMGFDALRDIRKQHPWRLLLSWIIPMAFVAFCLQKNIGEREWYVYVTTLALLAVYGILLMSIRCLKKWYPKVKLILFGMMSLEMAVTGVYGICLNGTVGRSTYVDEQKAFQALMPRQEGSEEFFRSEIDSQRMRNENMFMGANGLVMFSSTMPAATVDLCRSIGMEARTNKNGYNGVTKLFNDVFGIRYVVSKHASGDYLYQMEKVDDEDPLKLFYNDGALSLGFMVSSNIKEWDINDRTAMKVQDDFAELATGEPFFYTLREAYSLEEGPTYIIRLHPGEQTYIEFTENVKSLTIKTPQFEKTINNYTKNVFNLGLVTEEGEESKANITITYKENNAEPVPVRVYTCTDEEYQAVHDKLAANQLENVKEEGNKVSGTIHVDEAGTLLMTIPYDKGWKVKVDGVDTETYSVGEALTGIDLGEGDHEISMVFTPAGLWLGSALSLISVALFIISCYVEARIMKKKAEEKHHEHQVLREG
ncbi:MAG: YfhO family protein [Eubacteriales bacterium]|nr:YfhO family protein [Eubacteriales bacterium]